MSRLIDEAHEIGGRDPIDAAVEPPALPRVPAGLRLLLHTRAALGLGPVVAPALLFVPLGAMLGPRGLDVISTGVLGHLDAVVSVALAALGVFVGLALDLRHRVEARLLGAAAVEAGVTVTVVAAATLALLTRWRLPLDVADTAIALVLAICASASAAGFAEGESDPRLRVVTRIADLDDVLPIVAGAVLLASLQASTTGEVVRLAAFTGLLGLAVGAAGWLLFDHAHGDAERAVFVLGAVTLLGGCAAYLDLSPLLTGFVAGLFWTYAPGRADHILRADLRKIQHPLVVLVLLTAGASFEGQIAGIWLVAPFVVFRLTGKLVGGWLAARFAPGIAPADLGSLLVPPGLLGIAFALNFDQVSGPPAGPAVLSAVVLGTLLSEIVALVVVPHGGQT